MFRLSVSVVIWAKLSKEVCIPNGERGMTKKPAVQQSPLGKDISAGPCMAGERATGEGHSAQLTPAKEHYNQDEGLDVSSCWTTVMKRQEGRNNPYRTLTSNDVYPYVNIDAVLSVCLSCLSCLPCRSVLTVLSVCLVCLVCLVCPSVLSVRLSCLSCLSVCMFTIYLCLPYLLTSNNGKNFLISS